MGSVRASLTSAREEGPGCQRGPRRSQDEGDVTTELKLEDGRRGHEPRNVGAPGAGEGQAQAALGPPGAALDPGPES